MLKSTIKSTKINLESYSLLSTLFIKFNYTKIKFINETKKKYVFWTSSLNITDNKQNIPKLIFNSFVDVSLIYKNYKIRDYIFI